MRSRSKLARPCWSTSTKRTPRLPLLRLLQPHPPLLSGMRSGAGLKRTAAMFDIWNPASGTVEQIVETRAQIDAMRPEGAPPIEVYQRVFTEPPFVVAGVGPKSVDDLAESVRAARDAGFTQLIIDTAFTTEVASPDDWIAFPKRLAPVLSA